MRWSAFGLISPAVERTKKRLFPFEFWEWFKLMIISVLARNSTGGNFNSSGSGNNGDFANLGDFPNQLREAVKKYWIFGALIFCLIFILITIFSYIQSVFSFIFIDSLLEKKARFTFRKNNPKGVSLFLLKFYLSLLTIAVIASLGFPYVYNFMLGNPIIASLGWWYVILSIFLIVLYFILLWLLFLFLYDFAVPYMYVKNTPAAFSLKKIWANISKNKLETFVYWLARLVLIIALGVIGILVLLVILIVFVLIGLAIFAIGWGIYKFIGALTLLIVLGIVLGVLLFLIFLAAVLMILLPISIFMRYFQLLNFEKLTGIRILKK